MSTVINNAYCVLGRDKWATIWRIEELAKDNVKKILRKITSDNVIDAIEFPDKFCEEFKLSHDIRWQRFMSGNDERTVEGYVSIVWRNIVAEYKKQVTSAIRNVWNFDVCMSVSSLNGRLYIRTHSDCMMRDVFAFLENMENVVDYSYDNREDRPVDVSPAAWLSRKKTWNRLMREDGTLRESYIDVCSHKIIDSYDMNPLYDKKFMKLMKKRCCL